MNPKTKNKARSPMLRVKKYLKYQAPLVIIFVVFFVFSNIKAANQHVVINEVLYQAEGSNDAGKEWVELYNPASAAVVLTGYELYVGAGGYYVFPEFSLKSKALVVIYLRGDGKNEENALYQGVNNKSNMSNTAGSIALFSSNTHSENTLVDFVEYKKVGQTWESAAIKKKLWNLEEFVEPVLTQGNSIRLAIDGQDNESAKDWIESCEKNGTPGKTNNNSCNIIEPKIYPKGIIINEIFPAPAGADENGEFIELYNSGDNMADLIDWKIQDYKKVLGIKDADLSPEHTFQLDKNYCSQRIEKDNCQLRPKKYIIVDGMDYYKRGLTLNNANGDIIGLIDPDGKLVMQVSYLTAKENLFYAFDGSSWHWTKFLTKGDENIFEDVPAGTLDLDDDVYVNVYAEFEVKGLSKKAKVTWNFGDGHKSYLQKTRHKFEKTREYQASVKFSEGSEEVIKNFTVKVEKFPHPDVDIVAIKANPKGSDTLGETITIKNSSKKKLDLFGWSIATGSDKKLINHPITEKFVLKKKEVREITRDFSKFTLNNKQGKIELKYPDGKVAYKLKYEKKDGIAEDETYEKIVGGWGWAVTQQKSITKRPASTQEEVLSSTRGGQETNNIQNTNENQDTNIKKQETNNNQDTNSNNQTEENVSEVSKEIQPPLGKLEVEIPIEIEILKPDPKILGAETVRIVDNQYFFTSQTQAQEHWMVVFLRKIALVFNEKLNWLLNFF